MASFLVNMAARAVVVAFRAREPAFDSLGNVTVFAGHAYGRDSPNRDSFGDEEDHLVPAPADCQRPSPRSHSDETKFLDY